MNKQSDGKKDLEFITFILGCFIGVLVEQVLNNVFKLGSLSQQVFFIFLLLIIAFLIFFLNRIKKNIQENLKELIEAALKKASKEIPCTFIQDQEERLEKIISYIKLSTREILIYSHLSDEKETSLIEHKKYLDALNDLLENKKDIEFLRIVVPSFNTTGMSDTDIRQKIKEHPVYQEHFEKINTNRENDEPLIVQKNGIGNTKIILIDGRYLFLSTSHHSDDDQLNRIIRGGFFFDDVAGIYTSKFKRFFNKRGDRLVVN